MRTNDASLLLKLPERLALRAALVAAALGVSRSELLRQALTDVVEAHLDEALAIVGVQDAEAAA